MLKKIILTLLFFGAVFISSLHAQMDTMLDNQLLKKAGLSYVWESGLSLQENEKIAQMWLLEDKLFVLTAKNYLYCISSGDGRVYFSKQIVNPGLPVYKPQIIDSDLMMLAANKILVIDPNLGTVKGQFDPVITSVNRPVKRGENLLMIGADKRIHIVRYEDKLRLGNITSDDGSAITSVIATNNSAFMATKSGLVICFDIGLKRKYWQFKTEDAVTADLVYDKGSVFISCEDTKLYNLSESTGKVQWIFRAGRPLLDSVRIGDNAVYQFAKYKGLYGIDRQSGQKLWVVEDGLDILTEKDSKAYTVTSNDTIVIMDNKARKKVYSLNVTGIENYVSDSHDKNIYLSDGTGRVACLMIK